MQAWLLTCQSWLGKIPPAGISRWLFLRLLGIVYLAAFVSLRQQIDGLIGSRGILPADRFLHAVHETIGTEAYWRLPTLCWLVPGDAGLHALCGTGVFLSALLVLGFAPGPVLVGLWACYLSLTGAGQIFLGYQWDALLLETGFLAIFYAPWGLGPWPRSETTPSPAMRWLLRWLLFRLMFTSGVAKFVSGDPTWRDFTALEYHYETQPLPTWTSWYLHQAPPWFQQLSVALTFLLEIGVPVLLFAGRRPRHWACLGIILLQALIAFSGNYGFFNLLTIALCVPQLDDSIFPAGLRTRMLGPRVLGPPRESGANDLKAFRLLLVISAAGILFLLSLVPFLRAMRMMERGPAWLKNTSDFVAAFHIANNYGLFAVMTTERPEIIIEGSSDGETWTAYEFRGKPGDVKRRPEFAAPHMPRLDWQMWFAALGSIRDNPWFDHFLERLMEGEQEVLALLESNPFPARPPRFLRATLYRYRFTDAETREQTGAWWQRERLGPYSPLLSRKEDGPS
jgi:uncharacterized membrane protein YphA (DoxX/SURF4 family)